MSRGYQHPTGIMFSNLRDLEPGKGGGGHTPVNNAGEESSLSNSKEEADGEQTRIVVDDRNQSAENSPDNGEDRNVPARVHQLEQDVGRSLVCEVTDEED